MKQKKESILRHLRKHTTKVTALLTMLCTLLAVTLSSCGGEPQTTGVCDNCRQTKPLYEVKISGTGMASFLSGTFDLCNDCAKKVTADAEAQAASLGVKLSITTKKKTTPQKESLSGALSSAFAAPAKTEKVKEPVEAAAEAAEAASEAEEVNEAAPAADAWQLTGIMYEYYLCIQDNASYIDPVLLTDGTELTGMDAMRFRLWEDGFIDQPEDDFLFKHSVEIMENGFDENGNYLGDMDALLEDYQRFLDGTAEFEAPVSGQELFVFGSGGTMADISTKDNVLFDRDGVRFLFDGLRMVNDPKEMAYFDFTLENNNPDYKIATVEMQSISFNELEPDGIMYIFNLLGEWSNVEAGQTLSASTQNGYEMDKYDQSVLSALGVSSTEFPIETIGFAFKVRIGSEGEEEWHFVTLETENYKGKSYRKYFGEKAASFDGTYSRTGEPYTLDIYARVDDLGTTVVLLPAEGSESSFQTQMSIKLGANGKEMSPAMKDRSFESITLSDSYLFYPTGGTILRCAKTEEELRRSMEIGPNEALEIQLLGYYFDGGALTLLTK